MSESKEQKDEIEQDIEPLTPARTTRWWNVTVWCDDIMNANIPLREKEKEKIIEFLSQRAAKWAFQLEFTMKGRFHWQMVVEMKHVCTIATFKKDFYKFVELDSFVRAQHDKTFSYAMKKGGRYGPFTNEKKKRLPRDLDNMLPYPWQAQIVQQSKDAQIESDVANVLVNFDGGVGKSKLCKYMLAHGLAYVVGKEIRPERISQHMASVATKRKWLDENLVQTILINCPRGWNQEHLWSNVETIKDGMFTEDRYSSDCVPLTTPIVWVFMNEEPEYWRLSARRWKLWMVGEDGKLKQFVRTELSETYEEPKKPLCERAQRVLSFINAAKA